MLNFVMIVEDAGELKTVTSSEFIAALNEAMIAFGFEPGIAAQMVDGKLNQILDARAISAGEYDPSDNDTSLEVV